VAPFTATPWTHLLLPGWPGANESQKLQPYAVTPRLALARRLADGHLRGGKIKIAYRSTGFGSAQLEVVRRALVGLGFAREGITAVGFSGADLYDAMGKRSPNFDLGVSGGWCADFGPSSLLESLASASPKHERGLAAAKRLGGDARARALGRLDVALMKEVAPVAVMRTYNNLYGFSNRVDPKSLVYQSVYSDWSIPALALK
jgi:hypothetical protein